MLVIIGKQNCIQCDAFKNLLDEKGIECNFLDMTEMQNKTMSYLRMYCSSSRIYCSSLRIHCNSSSRMYCSSLRIHCNRSSRMYCSSLRIHCSSFSIVPNINHSFSTFEETLTHFNHV